MKVTGHILIYLFCFCSQILFAQDADKLFNKGFHYLSVDNDLAIKYLTESITLDSIKPESYYFRGIAYFKKDSLKNALEDYRKALSINKNLIMANIYIGFVYRKLNKPDSAILYFTKCIDLNPADTSAYTFILRGKSRQNAGLFEESLNDFNRATDLHPIEEKYHYYKYISHFEMRQYNKAIEHINKSIEINNEFYGYYYYKGNAYFELSKFNEAIHEYSTALELNFENSELYYKRGMALIALGKSDAAIKDFSAAIAYDPYEGLYFYQRGHTKQKMGDKVGACEDWYEAGVLGYYEDFDKIKEACGMSDY